MSVWWWFALGNFFGQTWTALFWWRWESVRKKKENT
jgi:hypothetical protein